MLTNPYDYTLAGVSFKCGNNNLAGAANVFNRGRPEGDDLSPHGHVREMVAFIERMGSFRTLLDIGAEAGIFSIVFAQQPGTLAFAVEGSHLAFPLLVENCRANPSSNILPLHVFAGDAPNRRVHVSSAYIHVVADGDGSPEWHSGFYGKSLCPQGFVTATRLDDMPLLTNASIDLVKIDVEGFECAVLRGMATIIRQRRPTLFLESHGHVLEGHGESASTLYRQLREAGYRVTSFDGNDMAQLEPMTMRVLCLPE